MQIFDRNYEHPKKFLPGTRRTRSPGETLADFGRHMREMGITRLANVTGLDYVGIPVIQAVRPGSFSLSVSQGKGVDIDSARVSAMMECMELWHAEQIESPLRSASYSFLRRREKVVDIHKLPRSAGAIVRNDVQRTWIKGWDLIQREPVWVPFEVINMNTLGHVFGNQTFCTSSNGLASGNHLLEAIEHALCEAIERDTHAMSWAHGRRNEHATRVDLSTVEDASILELLAKFRRAELDVAAFEMESDVAIPTYSVAVMDREDRTLWRRLGVQWGVGTHLSPNIALSRALTEAAQARVTIIAGSRDDNPPEAYANEQVLETHVKVRETVFKAPYARTFPEDDPTRETPSFEGDLERMLARLVAVGIERAIIVDLTKGHLQIPVVKVVVPGLEGPPFMVDYTPGERAIRAKAGMS